MIGTEEIHGLHKWMGIDQRNAAFFGLGFLIPIFFWMIIIIIITSGAHSLFIDLLLTDYISIFLLIPIPSSYFLSWVLYRILILNPKQKLINKINSDYFSRELSQNSTMVHLSLIGWTIPQIMLYINAVVFEEDNFEANTPIIIISFTITWLLLNRESFNSIFEFTACINDIFLRNPTITIHESLAQQITALMKLLETARQTEGLKALKYYRDFFATYHKFLPNLRRFLKEYVRKESSI